MKGWRGGKSTIRGHAGDFIAIWDRVVRAAGQRGANRKRLGETSRLVIIDLIYDILLIS